MLTAKAKDVSKQIAKNQKFEISTMDKIGRWIRISGKLIEDNRVEAIESATIYEFTDAPVVLND